MRVPDSAGLPRAPRSQTLWHVALIVAVSSCFESLFIHHGIGGLFDEGWPLYAAMQLHAGGTLYGDIFFLFPPGHLLPAWIAYALDPPGVVLARILYAAFNVALCVSLYALGRHLTTPGFALLAALMLAVAAPRSHLNHLLFGYRYLVFGVLALLAFSIRLRSRNPRLMWLAGVSCGVALFFRLTPAFAVSCGIGVGVLSAYRDWRVARLDLLLYAAGIATVTAPVLAWFGAGVGLDALFGQAVLRILPLQSAQSLPIPELLFPQTWDRELISRWFVTVQYILYSLVYALYAIALGIDWVRARRSGRPFSHPLLLAVVVWGAVYLVRTLGRSDEHHLMTALPPACLIVAHTLGLAFRARIAPDGARSLVRRLLPAVTCAGVLVLWVGLQGSDVYLDPRVRGIHPLESLEGEVSIRGVGEAARLDRSVARIRDLTGPDDIVLDLAHSPLIHVLTGRRGPGHGDVVTPGVFADPEVERRFVERLRSAPPTLVLWPRRPFDGRADRALDVHAPHLARWVRNHYVPAERERTRALILRRRRLSDAPAGRSS